jgi:hypothetical protein
MEGSGNTGAFRRSEGRSTDRVPGWSHVAAWSRGEADIRLKLLQIAMITLSRD